MTYDQYWYGDVWMVVDFIKADEERQKRQNQEAWLQGMYIYDAVSCAIENAFKKKGERPAKYPEQPYDIFKEDKSKKENVIDDGMTKEERELLIAKITLDNERRASKKM